MSVTAICIEGDNFMLHGPLPACYEMKDMGLKTGWLDSWLLADLPTRWRFFVAQLDKWLDV